MDKNIKKMYCFDCAILGGLTALLVFLIGYVLCSLGYVLNEWPMRVGIMASGLLALLFALTGMATVMIHLHKNSSELYKDNIEWQGAELQIETINGKAI